MKNIAISSKEDWNFKILEEYYEALEMLGSDYGLELFPNQIEIITRQQMLETYTSHGLPMLYNHWSFGKHYIDLAREYQKGTLSLAYEIVINSNPCISYLIAENSLPMQIIVMAHACIGHNAFFKSNYLYKSWTHPHAILDYLIFAKNYISECEQKYGIETVEEILDACHALLAQGIDPYQKSARTKTQHTTTAPIFPQENILYFIEKHSTCLAAWEREIVRIVHKLAEYFYPQAHTQMMNEGWSSFWHYTLINDLYEKQLVTDDFMFEFLQVHTNVLHQPAFDSPQFQGLNPYCMGFNICADIKRICEQPTAEDLQWFPTLAHQPWTQILKNAIINHTDTSFIAQYLSPRVIREMRLFSVLQQTNSNDLEVKAIHDEEGYSHIRTVLAQQYHPHHREPHIYIAKVAQGIDKTLELNIDASSTRPLADSAYRVLSYLYRLWGSRVTLSSYDVHGHETLQLSYPSN